MDLSFLFFYVITYKGWYKNMHLEPIDPSSQKPKGISKIKKIFQIIAILAIAFFYDIFPLDIIPDFIPFLGWGDDLVITILSLFFAYKKSKGVPHE
jgi:hypothetical protein